MKQLSFSVLAFAFFSVLNAQEKLPNISSKNIGDTLFSTLEIIPEKRINASNLGDFGSNLTILSKADIAQLPVTTIQEALQYMSGLDLRARNLTAQGDVSLWGSTFEQVLILIDGIPMRDPQTGHHQLNLPIDLSQVQSIQLIKGAAARMYGAGALAGAINIITQDPGKVKASIQSFWGTNGQTDSISGETYISNQQLVSIGFRAGAISHSFSFRRLHSNGYDINTGVDQQNLFYRGKWQNEKAAFHWMGGYLNNQFGAKNFYAPPYDATAIERVNTSFAGASGYFNTGKILWSPRVYYRYNTDDYTLVALQPEIYRNQHYSTSGGAEINGNWAHKKGIIGFGMDGRGDWIRSNNLGKHERFLYCAYLEERWMPSENLNVTAGVNMQTSPSYSTKFFPSLNVLFKQNKAHFFIHSGAGSRLPSYTDLYYSDYSNLGNPNLTTEYGWSAETGVRYQAKYFKFQMTYFYRRVNNQIDFTKGYETGISPSVWYPVNIGLAQTAGTEWQLSGTGLDWNILQKSFFSITQWGLRSNFLKSNLANSEYISKYVYNQLNQQHIAFLGFRTGNYVQHQITYRGLERAGQEFQHLLDWRTSIQIRNWNFFADIANITNQLYSLSGDVQMPRRWYQLGVQFQLLNDVR
jgi:vitamin B12 transporter